MAARSFKIPDGVVDIVESPDDGGFYVQETRFSLQTDRVSKKIYPTIAAAEQAWRGGRMRWEK